MKDQNTISTSKVVLLGIDTAKLVFQILGVDKYGKPILKKRLPRSKFVEFISNFPKCTIAMEACGASHHWGRTFKQMGRTVNLIPAQFVKPYVGRSKNDARDAEAICEAASRPKINERLVPIKTVRQQNIQALHRVREELVKNQLAFANQIRGLLIESGVIITKGIYKVYTELPLILEDASNNLTDLMRDLIATQYSLLCDLRERIKDLNNRIKQTSMGDELPLRLQKNPGIGPVCSSMLYTAVGNGKQFKRGRNMAAWMGLVPRQYSSGNSTVLLGITKNGHKKLRSTIIQGARAVVLRCKDKGDPLSKWLQELLKTKGFNKTSAALANKNIRIAWAIMSKGVECNSTF